jgi:hypothetical protein
MGLLSLLTISTLNKFGRISVYDLLLDIDKIPLLQEGFAVFGGRGERI